MRKRANLTKRRSAVQLPPRDPLLSPRRSSKKNDPSKVVKAILRELPKIQLPKKRKTPKAKKN